MRKAIEFYKGLSKWYWVSVVVGWIGFDLLYHYFKIPRLFVDPFFYLVASLLFIYEIFFSKWKENISINRRLIGAMVGGMFIWMLIESSSKLFAKWAVWRFF